MGEREWKGVGGEGVEKEEEEFEKERERELRGEELWGS